MDETLKNNISKIVTYYENARTNLEKLYEILGQQIKYKNNFYHDHFNGIYIKIENISFIQQKYKEIERR
jgi:flagellar biosynthesis chaperone FliJ